MDKKFYTVPEVAELLKVSKNYIYELINRKQINYLRLSERRIRIPASALENHTLPDLNAMGYNQTVQSPKAGRSQNVNKRAK
ncbi:MAG: helix-turn-helix domain-containing protein [Desulfitobacteriia bacterium]|jgi:excisionase family DNA binding protein